MGQILELNGIPLLVIGSILLLGSPAIFKVDVRLSCRGEAPDECRIGTLRLQLLLFRSEHPCSQRPVEAALIYRVCRQDARELVLPDPVLCHGDIFESATRKTSTARVKDPD